MRFIQIMSSPEWDLGRRMMGLETFSINRSPGQCSLTPKSHLRHHFFTHVQAAHVYGGCDRNAGLCPRPMHRIWEPPTPTSQPVPLLLSSVQKSLLPSVADLNFRS